ncbi:2-hydroxyglutaryl-CoA dehydratase [Clostridia bacterium]|nr:2-hydroxyglutaryl-CoA dehydratase [Clostridia bacterium]
MAYRLGIDVGSTTVKALLLDEADNVLFKDYQRHQLKVRAKTVEMIQSARDAIGDASLKVCVTGSAGQGVASSSGIDFAQEVYVTGEMVKKYYPTADCVIELGGEDAKIIFISGGLDERMNGSCAGGTGAFIDQMAQLLDVSADELDKLSLESERIYTIASRCGVFAKSDIQPLLNQGAKKSDIAASIFQAVVDQTLTGLAQGRDIAGNVLFLGGPLYFFKGLQKRFKETLGVSGVNAVFPDDAPFAVALGSALYASRSECDYKYASLLEALQKSASAKTDSVHGVPLFADEKEYCDFKIRHDSAKTLRADIASYSGGAYLGIDCGSTTTKLVLLTESLEILYSYYAANKGNPVDIIRNELTKIHASCVDRITILSSCVTGYGEDLIKNAFAVDFGLVETIAHFKAAKFYSPNVDFILDIGGQDIKCFKIKNDAIDAIMLNEACSSGCGSFIESFAKNIIPDGGAGKSIEEFCKLGLFAENPVDLGSRCTVFMNSSVKQSQKEGATIGDISAGLSTSVVKNALYKVIRVHSADELGKNIVVQGGTFLNDAILRAFERELGGNVVRPDISGLMGAFGCAIYAKEKYEKLGGNGKSTILPEDELQSFTHESKTANCGICTNHCALTVNTFGKSRKFISGNKCERPLGTKLNDGIPNMYAFKLEYLKSIATKKINEGAKKIGIPLGLNNYELLPFWHALFSSLGMNVVVSDVSSHALYRSGQRSIPSDTACYPAKLMHGHIENLLEKGVDDIFYPCQTYNIDEKLSDNRYNCPVVAYYPELLAANMTKLKSVHFTQPYIDIGNRKLFGKRFAEFIKKEYADFYSSAKVKKAINEAYAAQDKYFADTIAEGKRAIEYARQNNAKLIALSGRPYHIDPEINHGIDKMLNSFGCVIITEDAAAYLGEGKPDAKVLNQWTYHARLYAAAYFVAARENCELVQLVSFGCGIDAITTDEVREICEDSGKLYTQIKIDEINNLGAARIRIRSMLTVSGS